MVLAPQVQGSGFLYRMVRHIVGALVAVGSDKLQPADISRMLELGSQETPGEQGLGLHPG